MEEGGGKGDGGKVGWEARWIERKKIHFLDKLHAFSPPNFLCTDKLKIIMFLAVLHLTVFSVSYYSGTAQVDWTCFFHLMHSTLIYKMSLLPSWKNFFANFLAVHMDIIDQNALLHIYLLAQSPEMQIKSNIILLLFNVIHSRHWNLCSIAILLLRCYCIQPHCHGNKVLYTIFCYLQLKGWES